MTKSWLMFIKTDSTAFALYLALFVIAARDATEAQTTIERTTLNSSTNSPSKTAENAVITEGARKQTSKPANQLLSSRSITEEATTNTGQQTTVVPGDTYPRMTPTYDITRIIMLTEETYTTSETLKTTVTTTQPTMSTEKDTTTEDLTTAEITTQPTMSTEKDTTTEDLTTTVITTQPTTSTEEATTRYDSQDTTEEGLETAVMSTQLIDKTTEPLTSETVKATTEFPETTVITTQTTTHDKTTEPLTSETVKAITEFPEITVTTTRTTTHDKTTQSFTSETIKDTTEIPETTVMSTQTITHECGTVTSREALSQPQGLHLSVRHDSVKDVVKGSAPWNARLYKHQSEIICGGTLINAQWVVTAASCFKDPPDKQNISVQISDQNERSPKFLPVEKIYRHESFDLRTLKNNIALVKLDSSLGRFTNYVKPICLASQTKYSELVAGGALGRVTKWRVTSGGGVGSPGYLTEAFLPFVGYQVCKRHFRQRQVIFTPKMFCAGYPCDVNNAYSGEIGASYSIKDDAGQWYLAGILSRDETYCRDHRYGVYTKYPKYDGWVQDKLTKFGRSI